MTIPVTGTTSFASTLARADVIERSPGPTSEGVERSGPSFADRVSELVNGVNAQHLRAEQAAESYANGSQDDIHGTMIALEQSDISFRLVSNIRSRLVEAYREVMRMGT